MFTAFSQSNYLSAVVLNEVSQTCEIEYIGTAHKAQMKIERSL